MKWYTILIICFIFVPIMNPIQKYVYDRCQKKAVAWIITFVIGFAILFSLYGIADLLGFGTFGE